MKRSMEKVPYRFNDEQHKKDWLIQSMQLARELVRSKPPKGIRDQTNYLLYLGVLYLLERTFAKKMQSLPSEKISEIRNTLGLEPADVKDYVRSEANFRKAADKFFSNPTKTTLWLSAV